MRHNQDGRGGGGGRAVPAGQLTRAHRGNLAWLQHALRGGQGDDTLVGNGGDDRITAGEGNDSINMGAGDDIASGGDGNDVVRGFAGRDFVDGGDGDDDMAWNDPISDVVSGGAGDDRCPVRDLGRPRSRG